MLVLSVLAATVVACGSDDTAGSGFPHGAGGVLDGGPKDSSIGDAGPDSTGTGGSSGAAADGSAGAAGKAAGGTSAGGTGAGGTSAAGSSAGGTSSAGSGAAGTSAGGTAGAGGTIPPHDCTPVDPQDCDPPDDTTPVYCGDFDPCYLGIVQAAIQSAIDNHPELFDMNPVDASAGCILVLDVAGYVAAVGEQIQAKGLCFDPGAPAYEEVGVKHDNAFAETFDILTSGMCVRNGGGAYRGWCNPPWF